MFKYVIKNKHKPQMNRSSMYNLQTSKQKNNSKENTITTGKGKN